MEVNRKKLFPVFVIVLLLFFTYWIGIQFSETTIRNFIQSVGPFGPMVLTVLIWLTHVVAPLSATPFYFAGFYLFGQNVIVYAYAAAIIASITNFWISKIWGRAIVEKLAGAENMEKVDQLTQNYGYLSLFIIRIFLGMFHDVISYLFGLTEMKFLPYFTVSVVGMIPGNILWYYLSTKIANPLAFTIMSFLFAYICLSAYILGVKFFRQPTKIGSRKVKA